MDLGYLDDFHENVALVFFPCHSSMVTFSHLPQLLSDFGAPLLNLQYTWLNPSGPLDRCNFYVGRRTDYDLPNIRRFFEYNKWDTDRTWKYDVVVVVGYNNLSNIVVDIPPSMFPWCSDYYGSTISNITQLPMPEIMTDDHIFRAVCVSCKFKRRRCNTKRKGGCDGCGPGACTPQIGMEIDKANISFVDNLLRERSTLCPAFQFFIATCGTKYGYTKAYTSFEKKMLKCVVQDGSVFGRELSKEAWIRTNCRAHQLVTFINGNMTILESHDLGGRLGFSVPPVGKKSKQALALAIPNFGIANPHDVYSWMNSAFQNPGEGYVADFMAWDTKLNSAPTRIILMVQFETIDSIYMMVGWV
jgi:hypothetical protein